MNLAAINRWKLPELALLLLGSFFALRELGTFPAAWSDDSLFMIVARQVAEGKGYVLPILSHAWPYPYILAVGPTLIVPVALAVKLLGFSVAAARIPMVIYIGLSALFFHLWAQRIFDRATARWATALLLTLSTFINTGKTVMGEIPGFFFLVLGLWLLAGERRTRWADVCIGVCFGLSIITKLTYGLLFPALGLAWLFAAAKKDRCALLSLTVIGTVAAAVFLPWRLLEMSSATGLAKDFAFLFEGEEGGLNILQGEYGILLRPQYLYYGFMLLLGSLGLWMGSERLGRYGWVVVAALIALFTLYFLSSFGWYRHLLPAHLLLIPFVVKAVRTALPPRAAIGFLLFLLLGQGYWQWDHRGSSASPAAEEAAAYVVENLQEQGLIVQVAAVYVRLPENPRWLFLTNPILSSRLPPELVTPAGGERCMALLRGIEEGDEGLQVVGRRYVLVPAPADCP